jgi:hypothetical protein
MVAGAQGTPSSAQHRRLEIDPEQKGAMGEGVDEQLVQAWRKVPSWLLGGSPLVRSRYPPGSGASIKIS